MANKVSILEIKKCSLFYAKTLKDAKNALPKVQPAHHPAAVIFWGGVPWKALQLVTTLKRRLKLGQ